LALRDRRQRPMCATVSRSWGNFRICGARQMSAELGGIQLFLCVTAKSLAKLNRAAVGHFVGSGAGIRRSNRRLRWANSIPQMSARSNQFRSNSRRQSGPAAQPRSDGRSLRRDKPPLSKTPQNSRATSLVVSGQRYFRQRRQMHENSSPQRRFRSLPTNPSSTARRRGRPHIICCVQF
jgi:hypothetical protein